MRVIAVFALICVGCTASQDEGSVFADPTSPEEMKSAPIDAPEPENPALAWHHWFTVDVPAVADGILELNAAETPDRPIAANQLTVFDSARRPIGSGHHGWFSSAVAAGQRYYVDVYADPAKGEVRLIKSFKPVIDTFEPNDDIDHATTLVPGEPSEVRLFTTKTKDDDTDYFRIPAKGKRTVRLSFANGSRKTYCLDVIADGNQLVGGTCFLRDLDASFLMPEHSENVFVRITGPSASESSTLTVDADW